MRTTRELTPLYLTSSIREVYNRGRLFGLGKPIIIRIFQLLYSIIRVKELFRILYLYIWSLQSKQVFLVKALRNRFLYLWVWFYLALLLLKYDNLLEISFVINVGKINKSKILKIDVCWLDNVAKWSILT